METISHIALSRQMVMRRQMDVIANNLANMTTSGYRGESLLFKEHLSESHDSVGISFVTDGAVVLNTAEGVKHVTGNDLDIAINGEGYFEIDTPMGSRFTRGGSFTLSAAGDIVTRHGYPVLGENEEPIQLPPNTTRINITQDGRIYNEEGEFGRLRVVSFEDEQALRKVSGGFFHAGEQEPEPLVEINVDQGMLEGSNVQGIAEMTKMIQASRSYTSAAGVVSKDHDRQQRAIRALGGPVNG